MPYRNLSHFISTLEEAGELVRIREFVSPRLEIPEVADRITKQQGPALLFENTGTSFPLLINAFGSEKRMCMALGADRLDDIGREIGSVIHAFLAPRERFTDKLRTLPLLRELASWMPKRRKGRGICQEVVMEKPDLTRLPVLTCWPADGGPFITLPCVHTVSPVSSRQSIRPPVTRNLGMYRMQVFGPDLAAMHWHLHKGGAHHFQEYKRLGNPMPVTVTLGGDPVYTYVATAPLPEHMDEYLLAGFLRKRKVELVQCLTNGLEVPADVDFVIEGFVDPAEEPIVEGPFGDHTGFYSLADYYPRFHVTCISHRKGAVYPATIVGIPPQEDAWIGKATERIFLAPLRLSIAPELTELHMPVEGVFHNLVLSGIEKSYPGQAEKVMNTLWGAGQMMFNKFMVVTDPDVELTDYRAVARAVSDHADPVHHVLFSKGPADILDHSTAQVACGGKLGIDATRKNVESPPAEPAGSSFGIDSEKITALLPEVTSVNGALVEEGIRIVIIAFLKAKKEHVRLMAETLMKENLLSAVRFVIFVDALVHPGDLSTICWLGANNTDPVRDCFYVEKGGVTMPPLFVDATRKTREHDQFSRDWPNVIVMDDATIASVDEKWHRLGLGPNIPSPSLKYKALVINNGAIS